MLDPVVQLREYIIRNYKQAHQLSRLWDYPPTISIHQRVYKRSPNHAVHLSQCGSRTERSSLLRTVNQLSSRIYKEPQTGRPAQSVSGLCAGRSNPLPPTTSLHRRDSIKQSSSVGSGNSSWKELPSPNLEVLFFLTSARKMRT